MDRHHLIDELQRSQPGSRLGNTDRSGSFTLCPPAGQVTDMVAGYGPWSYGDDNMKLTTRVVQGAASAVCLSCTLAITNVSAATTDRQTKQIAAYDLKVAVAAAIRAGSARLDVEGVSGQPTGKIVQTSTAFIGERSISIGAAQATVLLLGGVAYISGNKQGLTSYFGFPAEAGSSLSGRWISLHST